jgi:hypothetical protein
MAGDRLEDGRTCGDRRSYLFRWKCKTRRSADGQRSTRHGVVPNDGKRIVSRADGEAFLEAWKVALLLLALEPPLT